jgi:chromosome transmission fidelity protein 1
MVLHDESLFACGSLTVGQKFGELGQLLLNLVNIVPAGMVVFFSSYSILDTVRRLWSADRTLEKIGLRKKVRVPD